ncbi:Cytochrome P450 72A15 [Carex littledalei]|uniref:Cytochrome P450 72A15 n=1 Tax=Carex littledalei TaxID=544730 RepID=A0A833R838_9POAL|nr:Cytochrome P450 72A15 [Carex littledalei]
MGNTSTTKMQQIFSQFESNLWTWSLFIGAFSLLLTWGAARALEWAWFRPRRLERVLREQGLRGTVYRPLVGDFKENTQLNKEACAKPMPLSHDIIPRVEPLLHRSMKEFGKQSFTWFGSLPRVTIRDPELVREILSSKFGHFETQKIGRLGRLLADGGLIMYDGEKWAKHRRILNPAFHVEKLKRMLPAFATCCDELVDRWENSVGPDGSFELDVWPEMKILTGDVISRAAFGSSYQEGRRIFELQSELAERFTKTIPTSFLPFSWYLPTENNRRMKQMSREVHTLLKGIIAKREKAIQNGETTKDDLLGLLLESNMREMGQNGKSDSSLGMTTNEVIEECKVFYIAGKGTTSVLLTWTMVVLSMHPEWQEKVREEVLQHFGRKTPDYDGLSRLKIVSY